MAITYPRDLPFDGQFSGDSPFDLEYMQSTAITGGASPNVADHGPAYWVGKFATEVLSREQYEIWFAWLKSLRGGLRTFKGRPPRRKWPRMYPKGFAGLLVSGVQFDGTGNLQTIGAQRDTVTVNQVPNGFQLKIGCYFSIPVGGKQHLHKILEDATANGSGVVTLTVEPPIRPNATTAVEVLFAAPYCDMVVTSQSCSPRANGKGGTITFEAVQVMI